MKDPQILRQFVANLENVPDSASAWLRLRGIIAEARRDLEVLSGVDKDEAKHLILFMGSIVVDNPLTARQVAEAVNFFVSSGPSCWREAFGELSPEELAKFRFDRLEKKSKVNTPRSAPVTPEQQVCEVFTAVCESPATTPEEEDVGGRVSELLHACELFMDKKDKELAKFSFPDRPSMTKSCSLEFTKLRHLLSSRQVKVGIVGEPRSGKSCLAAALVGFPYLPRPSRMTLNFHHVTSSVVSASIPLELRQFLQEAFPEAVLDTLGFNGEITGEDAVVRVIRMVSDLLLSVDLRECIRRDFFVDIYLQFPIPCLFDQAVTVVDVPSYSLAPVRGAHIVLLVVDATTEAAPECLLDEIDAEINAKFLSLEDVIIVINKIDSCLEDPGDLRAQLAAKNVATIDTSARTFLLDSVCQGRQPSASLQHARDLLRRAVTSVQKRLPNIAIRRAQKVMADFLEELAIINAHQQDPIDRTVLEELERRLEDVSQDILVLVDKFTTEFIPEEASCCSSSSSTSRMVEFSKLEGEGDRLLLEAVVKNSDEVMLTWLDSLQPDLLDDVDEIKAELVFRWTTVLEGFCDEFTIDGSHRARLADVVASLKMTPVYTQSSSLSFRASRSAVMGVVNMANTDELPSVFASTGVIKRWSLEDVDMKEVAEILWKDFTLQLNAAISSIFQSFVGRGFKQLLAAFDAKTTTPSRLMLTQSERNFVENLASLNDTAGHLDQAVLRHILLSV